MLFCSANPVVPIMGMSEQRLWGAWNPTKDFPLVLATVYAIYSKQKKMPKKNIIETLFNRH